MNKLLISQLIEQNNKLIALLQGDGSAPEATYTPRKKPTRREQQKEQLAIWYYAFSKKMCPEMQSILKQNLIKKKLWL